MKNKLRADELVFKLGLSESRTKAQAYIMSGEVEFFCEKKQKWLKVKKAGEAFLDTTNFKVNSLNTRDVGRGAQKLRGAYAFWPELIEFTKNSKALDIGSSTGGFTQVLLENGAKHVVALDVGTHQLHERLRNNSKVLSIEKQHVLKVENNLWKEKGVELPFDIFTSDLSFISMKRVIPYCAPWLRCRGVWIMLIKPQFELESSRISKGGIVRDQSARLEARDKILTVAEKNGFEIKDVKDCPLAGAEGNVEFLVWLTRS